MVSGSLCFFLWVENTQNMSLHKSRAEEAPEIGMKNNLIQNKSASEELTAYIILLHIRDESC